MHDSLEKLANRMLDIIYIAPKSLVTVDEYQTYYLEAEKEILISNPNIFRAKLESFIEKQLEVTECMKDINVNGNYMLINLLNYFKIHWDIEIIIATLISRKRRSLYKVPF